MRKVVVTEFLTLDGVMEGPGVNDDFRHAGWTTPYGSEAFARLKAEELFAADALLLGRVTYQSFAVNWPRLTGDAFSERMNALPKHVATTTLSHLEWNNSHLLVGHTAEAVTQLKEDNGGDLLVYGSARLVRTLMEHDLVDLYRLLVYPVILGEGKKLFAQDQAARLRLTESRALSGGVQLLCYQPDRTPPAR